jgi:hypothetical protein
VWADVILRAEQQHVLYLLLWSAGSILAGTAVGALVLTRRRADTKLLGHFAAQTVAWGIAELVAAGVEWHGLALRDLSATARLEHSVWFGSGLALGIAVAGATLAAAGWRFGKRLGAVGSGCAVIVQTCALLWLDLQLLAVLSR